MINHFFIELKLKKTRIYFPVASNKTAKNNCIITVATLLWLRNLSHVLLSCLAPHFLVPEWERKNIYLSYSDDKWFLGITGATLFPLHTKTNRGNKKERGKGVCQRQSRSSASLASAQNRHRWAMTDDPYFQMYFSRCVPYLHKPQTCTFIIACLFSKRARIVQHGKS